MPCITNRFLTRLSYHVTQEQMIQLRFPRIVEAIACKTDVQITFPRSHKMEGENNCPRCVLLSSYVKCVTQGPKSHTHRKNSNTCAMHPPTHTKRHAQKTH